MALGKIYQIIPIVFAICLLLYQRKNIEEFKSDYYKPRENYFGIPIIDNCFNIFVAFFRQYLNDPTSLLLNHTILPIALVNLFIVAIEGSIPGVNGLVTHYTLIAAISMFFAISIAIPLIWIPAWIASENRKGNSPQPNDVKLNPKRVEKIFLGILSTLPFLVGLTIFKQENFQNWNIILFLFSFPCSVLFWVWYPKGISASNKVNSESGYELASKFSLALFGISIYEWFLVLGHSIDNNFEVLIGTITQLISGITYPATDYMMVDTWGIIGALIYWVYVAENAKLNKKFWKFIGQSILCGPGGALALYAYNRYHEMAENTNVKDSSSILRYTNGDERQPLLS